MCPRMAEPCKKVTLDGETYSLPLARGWTTYTIQAKDDPENPNPENPDPENPDKPDPGTPDDPRILEAIILGRI